MPFGLFLDENMPERLVVPLRRDGVDVLTAGEAGRKSFSDESQLEFATAMGRVLLTYDVADFVALAAIWGEAGRSHAGILLSAKKPFPELHRRIMRLWRERNAEDMANTVLWLSK